MFSLGEFLLPASVRHQQIGPISHRASVYGGLLVIFCGQGGVGGHGGQGRLFVPYLP